MWLGAVYLWFEKPMFRSCLLNVIASALCQLLKWFWIKMLYASVLNDSFITLCTTRHKTRQFSARQFQTCGHTSRGCPPFLENSVQCSSLYYWKFIIHFARKLHIVPPLCQILPSKQSCTQQDCKPSCDPIHLLLHMLLSYW